jgi:hypothetical protein
MACLPYEEAGGALAGSSRREARLKVSQDLHQPNHIHLFEHAFGLDQGTGSE